MFLGVVYTTSLAIVVASPNQPIFMVLLCRWVSCGTYFRYLLYKMASQLPTSPIAGAINSFNKDGLKPTETAEKNPLPSSADVKQEKTHQNILAEVEGGAKLRHTDTKEKIVLPSADDPYVTHSCHSLLSLNAVTQCCHICETGKEPPELLSEVEADHSLKKVTTDEKNPLPDNDGNCHVFQLFSRNWSDENLMVAVLLISRNCRKWDFLTK
ncbi:hypothetical protein EB796_014848 [Bugula neritina]|uniref:Uncharacterized protein n=1 Tax=Bugula neritina TaxID=10212 RepID=A0A7J7JMK4_BUGNE|nr:hypothetical protein EB796_014848 [Bugula neritina]